MRGKVARASAGRHESAAPIVCSVGTVDPWNAAGLGLDIRAVHELGGRPLTIVAGVSAQDSRGLHALAPVALDTIEAQFTALESLPIAAFRIGAIPTAGAIALVARLAASRHVPIVVDPVLAASGGGRFADAAAEEAIGRELLPIAALVTPNMAEAARLSRLPVDDLEQMAAAGARLLELGARAVLVKGGHAAEPVDVLQRPGEPAEYFEGSRVTGTMRGTGCLLAVTIAFELARGAGLVESIRRAKTFVENTIAHARRVGDQWLAF